MSLCPQRKLVCHAEIAENDLDWSFLRWMDGKSEIK